MKTYRARSFPFLLCVGFGVPMLLMALLLASMPLFDPAVEGATGLALAGALGIAVPALFLLKIGIDIRRTRIVIGSEALDVCLSVFRIWSLRKVRCARMAWPDVLGVQRFEIANPMAPNGVQVDFILHTRSGLLAISSMQFNDVDGIARAIASHTGRAVGELSEGTTPFQPGLRDRRGVQAMRILARLRLRPPSMWLRLARGSIVLPRLRRGEKT